MPKAKPKAQDCPWIPRELQHLAVPLSDLHPDPENANTHDEASVAAVRKSMERFGQHQLLIVQKQGMVVRVGNARLEAARGLGWSHLACLVVDEADVQAVARALADNRTAELSRWDPATLARVMDRLEKADPSLADVTGFTADDRKGFAALLSGMNGSAFAPTTDPSSAAGGVTEADVSKASADLAGKFAGSKKLCQAICPQCAFEFFVDPALASEEPGGKA